MYAQRERVIAFVVHRPRSPEQVEDEDTARLVTRIQAGRHELFAQLYERYFGRVYTYLRVALKNVHDAEDLSQQMFVEVFEQLPRYRYTGDPFRAWLFTIVRRRTISFLEREQRMDVEEPEEIDRRRETVPTAEELPALQWVNDRDLLVLMERLPQSQRQVLFLRYMLDLPHERIGSILGRPASDVALLHHRAMRFLNQRLTALGREPGASKRVRVQRKPRHAHVLRSRRFALIAPP